MSLPVVAKDIHRTTLIIIIIIIISNHKRIIIFYLVIIKPYDIFEQIPGGILLTIYRLFHNGVNRWISKKLLDLV